MSAITHSIGRDLVPVAMDEKGEPLFDERDVLHSYATPSEADCVIGWSTPVPQGASPEVVEVLKELNEKQITRIPRDGGWV